MTNKQKDDWEKEAEEKARELLEEFLLGSLTIYTNGIKQGRTDEGLKVEIAKQGVDVLFDVMGSALKKYAESKVAQARQQAFQEVGEEMEELQEHVGAALAWSDKHTKEEQLSAIFNHVLKIRANIEKLKQKGLK